MSDSEVEFQSADEGSNGDDGWEIECDFELPDVESSAVSKSTELKISSQPKMSNSIETEHIMKHKGIKLPENFACDTIPTIEASLNKLTVNSDNINSEEHIESKVVQNEIKSTSTQSGVSKNIDWSEHF